MNICKPCSDGPGRKVRVAALYAPDGDLCLDHARVLLRCYDPSQILTIAAGGGPRSQADHDVVYCPLCSCRKNGWADEPNHVDESCADPDCLCHEVSR